MKSLYARGTSRKNRSHLPTHLLFTKSEIKTASRGDLRFSVCTAAQMIAVSWIDGKDVVLISNADETKLNTCQRQIGGKKSSYYMYECNNRIQ